MFVNSIFTRRSDLFLFPCSGKKTERDIELTCNASNTLHRVFEIIRFVVIKNVVL